MEWAQALLMSSFRGPFRQTNFLCFFYILFLFSDFSDDLAWAREHLGSMPGVLLPADTLGSDVVMEFTILTQCNHTGK